MHLQVFITKQSRFLRLTTDAAFEFAAGVCGTLLGVAASSVTKSRSVTSMANCERSKEVCPSSPVIASCRSALGMAVRLSKLDCCCSEGYHPR